VVVDEEDVDRLAHTRVPSTRLTTTVPMRSSGRT
jgi:hypothetical protein